MARKFVDKAVYSIAPTRRRGSCAESERIAPNLVDSLGLGKCFLLVKPLNRVLELNLEDLLAFNGGSTFNSELVEIKNKVDAHRDFFVNL